MENKERETVEFKAVYCYGSKDNYKNVIAALEDYGGYNKNVYIGDNEELMYYITPDNLISCAAPDSPEGNLLRVYYSEIKPDFKRNIDSLYYYICCWAGKAVIKKSTDVNFDTDDERYMSGNYFHTQQEAETALNELCNIFKRIKNVSEQPKEFKLKFLDEACAYLRAHVERVSIKVGDVVMGEYFKFTMSDVEMFRKHMLEMI